MTSKYARNESMATGVALAGEVLTVTRGEWRDGRPDVAIVDGVPRIIACAGTGHVDASGGPAAAGGGMTSEKQPINAVPPSIVGDPVVGGPVEIDWPAPRPIHTMPRDGTWVLVNCNGLWWPAQFEGDLSKGGLAGIAVNILAYEADGFRSYFQVKVRGDGSWDVTSWTSIDPPTCWLPMPPAGGIARG